MRVSNLFYYPFKSARGIALSTAEIGLEGMAGDRRAMLVDPSGRFITQRELTYLARLVVTPGAKGYQLFMDGKGDVIVDLPDPPRRATITVWKSEVSAALADDLTNETLSAWFGRPVRLVFFDEDAQRTASSTWAGEGTPVAFADGYQILVTTTGSLRALNDNMIANGEDPVGMERFRPNIVIDSDEPFAEDRWAAIEIGGIRLDLVKPCARCIMTTQDQLTGSREVANPMPAMGRIRMSADRRVPGPLFGWNATPRAEGSITVGDTVAVVEERPEGWAIKQR
ncbi:MOSC domain-containing protein [Rhizobiaceae bacterium n13]|uniref:MOSC domain-containing protein n=1 Tax=Ferirhizobium litorale TaxID=2927786 RepID=A0AAE3U0E8_9HYPH|nr:MOSC domain-containing protein [Fererhizobium litorale]MDI7861134.1 MOSC domain-containing protein [Fererhizobium litorale]MDI7921281.1 MOSC domain-containing protein [Fererhizobium litorale]